MTTEFFTMQCLMQITDGIQKKQSETQSELRDSGSSIENRGHVCGMK